MLELSFDAAKLEYVSGTAGTVLAGGMADINVSGSKIILTFISLDGITGAGTIFNLNFKIKEGLIDQTIPLSLVVTELTDSTYWPLPPIITQGEVKVQAYTLGDLNNDGNITTLDALMALQIVSGRYSSPTQQMLLSADVTKDGSVTTIDALKILQYVSGRITGF
jgi:hypothetical protein